MPVFAQAGEITDSYEALSYLLCTCNGLVITTCPMNESVTTRYIQTTQTTTMPTN